MSRARVWQRRSRGSSPPFPRSTCTAWKRRCCSRCCPTWQCTPGRPLFPADIAAALEEVPEPRVSGHDTRAHARYRGIRSRNFRGSLWFSRRPHRWMPRSAKQIEEQLDTTLLEMFGSTETCVIATAPHVERTVVASLSGSAARARCRWRERQRPMVRCADALAGRDRAPARQPFPHPRPQLRHGGRRRQARLASGPHAPPARRARCRGCRGLSARRCCERCREASSGTGCRADSRQTRSPSSSLAASTPLSSRVR